jgi:hypothetical protein
MKIIPLQALFTATFPLSSHCDLSEPGTVNRGMYNHQTRPVHECAEEQLCMSMVKNYSLLSAMQNAFFCMFYFRVTQEISGHQTQIETNKTFWFVFSDF